MEEQATHGSWPSFLALSSKTVGPRLTGRPLVAFAAALVARRSRTTLLLDASLGTELATAGPRLTGRPLVAFAAALVARRSSTTLLHDASLGTELANSGAMTDRTTSGRVRCHVGRATRQHHSPS
jgi:hypothetical protein